MPADLDPLDVRDGEVAVDRVKLGMTSSSVGTLRSARKSVPGATVAGLIPRYPSTAGVAT